MKQFYLTLLSILFVSTIVHSQKTDANIFGEVKDKNTGEHIPYVSIYLKGTTIGTSTDETGHFMLTNLPGGENILVASMLGYIDNEVTVDLEHGTTIEVNFVLEEGNLRFNEFVVTGTRTSRRKTQSPVIVHVLDDKIFNSNQSICLADGLCFQPGLRVEVDCQTCNYTQLRMNGLGGAYSQVLINSRPIFSSLNGLYGLEQIPVNMIERVEIIRGGGSSLYGSSAIGGTVNIITKDPEENAFEFMMNNSFIDIESAEQVYNVNTSFINKKRNAGISLFGIYRDREEYDANGDGYSEIPKIRNSSFGLTSFYKPDELTRISVDLHSLYETRRGGNKIEEPAHKAEQSEERIHDVYGGGITLDKKLRSNNGDYSIYISGQITDRDHYTGIDYVDAYGVTHNEVVVAGGQFNYNTLGLFNTDKSTITLGSEAKYDNIHDEIQGYNYQLDQTTRQLGFYIQEDWLVTKKINLLAGARYDLHSEIDRGVLSPRFSVKYDVMQNLQFRGSFSTGFRAPQAFDADLHVAFAGGGVAFVRLDPNLTEETSNSFSASLDYNYIREKVYLGFTLEAFHTNLFDVFVLEEAGEDSIGNMILEKRNGGNSIVQGLSIEGRFNYNGLIQFESGLTIQKSEYDQVIEWSADIPGEKKHLRTPDIYGYYNLTLEKWERLHFYLSGILTGPMLVPHFAGAEGVDEDELVESGTFFEQNLKIAYTTRNKVFDQDFQVFAGVQNILNHYQDDFDKGRYRDSNYIYGPAKPITIYFGFKIGSDLME